MSRQLIIITLTFLLSSMSCNQLTQTRKEDDIKDSSSKKEIIRTEDTDKIKFQNRRKELEKQGFNYSSKIISGTKFSYENKELTFVQDILDSTNNVQGKVYVELINDSLFRRLYILEGNELRYFAGDNMFTNTIDTTEFGGENLGLRFELRYKYYFTISIKNERGGFSDGYTIQFIDKKKRFDNPYKDI